jgi:hypothetical protein
VGDLSLGGNLSFVGNMDFSVVLEIGNIGVGGEL